MRIDALLFEVDDSRGMTRLIASLDEHGNGRWIRKTGQEIDISRKMRMRFHIRQVNTKPSQTEKFVKFTPNIQSPQRGTLRSSVCRSAYYDNSSNMGENRGPRIAVLARCAPIARIGERFCLTRLPRECVVVC